ncbi:MAG: hypothetical protein ACOX9C_07100 [Kiritimatiellia bacterium]|jgi:hypothetical protein
MFNNLSGVELFYLACGVIGGGLFLLRSIMIFTGLGGDDDVGDVDDGDFGGDTTDDFKMVSVHGITAFLLMFGLVGFLLMRNGHGIGVSAVSSLAAGVVIMAVIAKIFSASRKLASDGTIHLADAVGCTGSVYLEIRPGAIGKVQIEVKGALKVFDARAKDPQAKLATGERIKVVETADMLVVEPA